MLRQLDHILNLHHAEVLLNLTCGNIPDKYIHNVILLRALCPGHMITLVFWVDPVQRKGSNIALRFVN